MFGPLEQKQVDGLNALLPVVADVPLLRQQAYILATAYHETAHTMQPVREYGRGKKHKYGKPGKHGGQVAYGRGYVQLTWDYNYEKADKELDLGGALIADYDLALSPGISAQILVRGMMEGWFTTRRLGQYVSADKCDYRNARRVVNGLDKADLIAGYARQLEAILRRAVL